MMFAHLKPPTRAMFRASSESREAGGFNVAPAVGCGGDLDSDGGAGRFPSFLPKEVEKIKDPFARALARRIERLPVKIGTSPSCIMSSCVKPMMRRQTSPLLLLHCFDSSCLEWRCTLPLLEEAGLEAWAVDVLGWGFSDLGRLPSCCVASKRHHLYQFWKSHIKRPIVLVGPSLGASVAIDFAVNYPEAVEKMVLINPSLYTKGTGNLTMLPKMAAYAGVTLLGSIPLRLYANLIAFNSTPASTIVDWTNVGRLHCLLPWWKDATVNFMLSGGYNVVSQIKQVKHEVLIVSSEHDRIIDGELALRLLFDLPHATMHQEPGCGHLPHVENPNILAPLIADFSLAD